MGHKRGVLKHEQNCSSFNKQALPFSFNGYLRGAAKRTKLVWCLIVHEAESFPWTNFLPLVIKDISFFFLVATPYPYMFIIAFKKSRASMPLHEIMSYGITLIGRLALLMIQFPLILRQDVYHQDVRQDLLIRTVFFSISTVNFFNSFAHSISLCSYGQQFFCYYTCLKNVLFE